MATENTQMIIDNVDALQVRMKEMRKAQQVILNLAALWAK